MKNLIILLICVFFYNCNNNPIKKTETFNKNKTETLYETEGNIVTVTIKKDSLIIEKSEYILDNQTVLDTTTNIRTKYEYESPGALGGKWTEYYSNGNIKARGQTADQFACWANVGDFEYYDINGVLLRVLTYDNWLMNPNDGCHSMIINMKLIEYYKNGNIKAEKYYQSGYEDFMFSDFYNNSEIEKDYKCGNWQFYDITGKVIKVKEHKTIWKKGNI